MKFDRSPTEPYVGSWRSVSASGFLQRYFAYVAWMWGLRYTDSIEEYSAYSFVPSLYLVFIIAITFTHTTTSTSTTTTIFVSVCIFAFSGLSRLACLHAANRLSRRWLFVRRFQGFSWPLRDSALFSRVQFVYRSRRWFALFCPCFNFLDLAG